MKKNRFLRLDALFFLIAGLFSLVVTSCKETEEDKVKPVTITDIILKNNDFSMLRDIMIYAGMSDAMRTENYTLFAPDNDAFEKANIFSSSVITSLPKDSARFFLQNHILKNRTDYKDLQVGSPLALNKNKLIITKADSIIAINKSEIVIENVNAANGVIHVIDSVLVR